jgi:hypothetical protein
VVGLSIENANLRQQIIILEDRGRKAESGKHLIWGVILLNLILVVTTVVLITVVVEKESSNKQWTFENISGRPCLKGEGIYCLVVPGDLKTGSLIFSISVLLISVRPYLFWPTCCFLVYVVSSVYIKLKRSVTEDNEARIRELEGYVGGLHYQHDRIRNLIRS